MTFAAPLLYFDCGCCSCYYIVVIVVNPLSSGTDNCISLIFGTALPQEFSFSRENDIGGKYAARLVLV